MIQIPLEHSKLIPDILEWHTTNYTGISFLTDGNQSAFDEYSCNVRLKRLLDKWYKNHTAVMQEGELFSIESKEIFYLRQAMSDALDNIDVTPIQNVEKEAVISFLEWLDAERKNSKK